MPLTNQAELRVLFDDGSIYALSKPAMWHSCTGKDAVSPCVAKMLLDQAPELSDVSPRREDAGLVNRLDRETSGVMLGAWSRSIWEQLHRQILDGKILKSYLAVVEGELSTPLEVRSHIGSPNRHAKKQKIYLSNPPDRALPAHTLAVPVAAGSGFTVLNVEAHTARRHQIRAHLAHAGYPLVGDELYGAQTRLPAEAEGAPAFILHARMLRLKHPRTGIDQLFVAELPEYLDKLLSACAPL